MDIFLHVLLISVCGDSLNSCFMYKCFFSHVLPINRLFLSGKRSLQDTTKSAPAPHASASSRQKKSLRRSLCGASPFIPFIA